MGSLQANAKKISLEVPGAEPPPAPSSGGGRRVSGGDKARRRPQKGLTRQTTLALLTLDEDEQGHINIELAYVRTTALCSGGTRE